jgi:hypothetical protein
VRLITVEKISSLIDYNEWKWKFAGVEPHALVSTAIALCIFYIVPSKMN